MSTTIQTGTFNAVNDTSPAVPVSGAFNIAAWGGSGSLNVQRSFDQGATWVSLQGAQGVILSGSSATLIEPESGILYRLVAGTLAAGPVNWRISQ